jgi:hypothetical protein
MIVASVVGAAKMAALLVTVSCSPVPGTALDKCDEKIEQSWLAPSPSELKFCATTASNLRARGTRAWCELLPADDAGIEPAAVRAEPVSYRF